MKLSDRLDPSLLDAEDRALIEQLNALVQDEERPALVGREGVRIDLPDPVFHLLVKMVRAIKAGDSIVLMPEKETLTTQAAANFLGVSRPFFVQLLDNGEISHHLVGTHRRVYLRDLLDYMKRRDSSRREAMDQLFDKVQNAGVYDNA